MECWRRQSREQPGCQPGSGNPILALCMQTRSRGSSNLLSPHELQRAEREKRERRARNRAERESTSEVDLQEPDSDSDTMAANAGGAPPPGVNPPPGIPVHAQRPARLIGAATHQHSGKPPRHYPTTGSQQ
ncbi:unnamed protein product [Microthlaspi erraticum]|uniref:Uncharacterized protein n=1 Tax=Microthlaspi erraticum TaxID=1685480 RepID=A0A6D2L9K6_9BRAS|nr:unnamed protein product [Microthlaspi erraticum]